MRRHPPTWVAPLLPIGFFFIATGRHFGEAPALDSLLFYREATVISSQGLSSLYRGTHTAHPPLLQLLIALAFRIAGRSPAAYTAVGATCFVVGAWIVNGLVARCYSARAGFAATALLYSCPLVVVNAFYPTHESVLLAVIASALSFFTADRRIPFGASLILLVLLKQTALVALVSFFAARLLDRARCRENRRPLAHDLVDFVPALAAGAAWAAFLHRAGGSEWRGDLLGQGPDRSTYLYIGARLLRLQIFNPFLVRNLANALVLNLQWLITLTALALVLLTQASGRLSPSREAFRCTAFLAIFSLLYGVLVLSIPTWTIPRYGIPLLLGLYVLLGVGIDGIESRTVSVVLVTALLATSWVANIASIDPVTLRYGTVRIYGQRFYDTPEENAGADRSTYNLQFVDAVASQNALIEAALRAGADALVTDCHALKLDEKLDAIREHREFYPGIAARSLFCVDAAALGDPRVLDRISSLTLYVPPDDRMRVRALLANGRSSTRIVGER